MGSSWYSLIFFVVIIVVFYFLLIRPENKRKKQVKAMRENLAVGDVITTIGGITGKIVDLNNDFLTFETGADRVRVEVARWAVSTVGKSTEQK